jgi:hypothetical protein
MEHVRAFVTAPPSVWVLRALVLVAILRLLSVAHSGLTYIHGDFYATLPGAHVREMNPALWNSPDLVDSWAFQREDYLYGPTQFLTLYPVALFDSYEDIARFLLVAYGVLLLAALGCMALALRHFCVGAGIRVVLLAGTALYLPLLQAYVQREFETIVVLVLAIALFAVVTRRKWLAGLAVGYITWFKFFPIVFLVYFLARGWWRAVAGFAVASAVILSTTHVVFDLRRFAPVLELVSRSTETALSLEQTCKAWLHTDQTFASARYGLCRLGGPADFLLFDALFWIAVGSAMLLFGVTFVRAARLVMREPADEQMRRMLEFSFMAAFSAGVFYGHYYYLAQLVIPINVLVYRYSTSADRRAVKVGLLVIVYALLTAFIVPTTVIARVFGIDAWRLYMNHALYLYGQALLIALLLWEYCALVKQAQCGGGRGIRSTIALDSRIISGNRVAGSARYA